MGSIKSDKIVAIIEVIVLLILMIAYFIKVCLPDIKKNIGSSDKIISYTNYLNMFEINIDGDVNFAFVINKDYKINHIMFFSKNTRCLWCRRRNILYHTWAIIYNRRMGFTPILPIIFAISTS